MMPEVGKGRGRATGYDYQDPLPSSSGAILLAGKADRVAAGRAATNIAENPLKKWQFDTENPLKNCRTQSGETNL